MIGVRVSDMVSVRVSARVKIRIRVTELAGPYG